jgi:GNAT superfamily N-acetyltransferase
MPQPRAPREPTPQTSTALPPSVSQVAAGSAAATAAPGMGLAIGGAAGATGMGAGYVAAATAGATGYAAIAAATTAIVGGLTRFFRQQGVAQWVYLEDMLRAVRGGQVTDAVLKQIIADEKKLEAEFQRKAIKRWREALPKLLSLDDPQERADALRRFQEREKGYVEMRQRAMVERADAKVERHLLRQISPRGAYWKLSPYVSGHTLDCLFMGEKFWPWEVLDQPGFSPPLHHGCPCQLYGLDEAVARGLMTLDEVPDADEAMRRAREGMRRAQSLMEAVGEDVFNAWAVERDALRLAESYNDVLHPRDRIGRWRKKLGALPTGKDEAFAATLDMPDVRRRRDLPGVMLDGDEAYIGNAFLEASPDERRRMLDNPAPAPPGTPMPLDALDVMLKEVLQPEKLDADTEVHPKSGWPIKVGRERHVKPPPEGQREAPLEFNVVEHGGVNGPMFPQKVGTEPVKFVYRGVSEEEWAQAEERGFLQSDLRGVISDWEGTNAGVEPRTAVSYLPHGGVGRVLKIRVEPEDEWFAIPHDSYARTRKPIPLDRVVAKTGWLVKDDLTGLRLLAESSDVPQSVRLAFDAFLEEAWNSALHLRGRTGEFIDMPDLDHEAAGRRLQAVIDRLDGFEHAGLRTTVSKRRVHPPSGGEVEFDILDESGEMVGYIGRSWQGDAVKLDRLWLEPQHQGSGFATAFYKHSLSAFRDLGFEKVKTQAIQVGSYAWAKWGFRFDRRPQVAVEQIVTDAVEKGRWNEAVQAGVPDWMQTDFVERVTAGRFTSEAELASYGREHVWTENDQAMWLGKKVLMNAGWFGTLDLR